MVFQQYRTSGIVEFVDTKLSFTLFILLYTEHILEDCTLPVSCYLMPMSTDV